MPDTDTTFIRYSSHRARERVTRLLGFKPREFWNWNSSDHLLEVPAARLAELRAIPGVTKARSLEGWQPCIAWN